MKSFFLFALILIAATACVPAKKYNDLLAQQEDCSKALADYKSRALNSESELASLKEEYSMASAQLETLKSDTAQIGHSHRTLRAKYDKQVQLIESLETNYDKLRLSGAKETASLQAELSTKQIELQRKEDELSALEQELKAKLKLLEEREKRVNELEEVIRKKDEAVNQLKDKVAHALRGFKDKGLSVEERNGKIYVSLEAKLLFASGSTTVAQEGEKALIELSKVLESEKELEIIVEGHTDSDALARSSHPKNNWELSVLRSTAVIELMIQHSSIEPKQLMAAGRSEYHPVDEADKAKNRRIEIIISPNLNELYELISN